MSTGAQSAVPAPPPLKKKAAPKKASEKPARVLREDLTTATATAEHKRQRPLGQTTYKPLDGEIAPLRPESMTVDVEFVHDNQITHRRYNSMAVHGALDYHFDAEEHAVSKEYSERLLSTGLTDGDMGRDPLLEQELEARSKVIQPPEAIEQFHQDMRNPNFINRLRSTAVAPRQVPPELAYRLAEQSAAGERMSGAATAMAPARANADFFASLTTYNLPVPRSRAEQYAAKLADQKNLHAILDVLDRELDGANDADGTHAEDIRRERAELLALEQTNGTEASENASSNDDDDDDNDVDNRDTSAADTDNSGETFETDLSPEKATELFNVNPLALLPAAMRGDFMQLPEIAAVWRLLYPLVIQKEEHHRHYNGIEFVRGLALCGAKFDGCVRLTAPARLARVVDAQFYKEFINPLTGVLSGGHEHYNPNSQRTTLLVFKFYIVQHNKNNIKMLHNTVDEHNKNSADENAQELDKRNRAASAFMQLNRRGLYDFEKKFEADEDDGTDEFGSLHSIRHLAREFMFCLRVVCVEPSQSEYPIDADVYPSETDDPVPNNDSFESDAPAHGADADAASDMSGARSLSDSLPMPAPPTDMNVDAALYMHSDDEGVDDHDELVVHAATPTDKLVLTKKTAEMCVGKWKADLFMFLINSRVINQLCVRAFLFYSDNSVTPIEEEPAKK